MAINNREVAARKAEASTSNSPGTCQLWTRTQFNAPSAGDVDHDGDSDAIDGWKSEPTTHRHTDRNPPRGVPIAFKNKSGTGHGHRAISLGGGKVRSTDMSGNTYKPGTVGTTTIAALESAMGLDYLGWSDTIDGEPIPLPTRGKTIDAAIKAQHVALSDAQTAYKYTQTASRKLLIADAIKSMKTVITKLEKIPYI